MCSEYSRNSDPQPSEEMLERLKSGDVSTINNSETVEMFSLLILENQGDFRDHRRGARM